MLEAYPLGLVAQTLLVTIFAHAFAALVLVDFSFPFLFERTHFGYQGLLDDVSRRLC
jgi:hypothetical protein